MRNWGAYARVLKAAGADRKVTGLLEHIRKNYRNPVFLPEESSSPEDAQALLWVCVSAIITMVQAMQAIPASQPAKAKAAPPPAPAKHARAKAAAAGG